jgi:hypothetical protein
MARNVRIDADPPFQSSQDASHPESLAQLKIFAEGIPAMAPGKRLDLDLYNNLVAIRRFGIHDLADQLKKTNRHLDRWSAAGGGLLVVSPAEKRRRDEELRAWVEQEQATADGQAVSNRRSGLIGRLLMLAGQLRR